MGLALITIVFGGLAAAFGQGGDEAMTFQGFGITIIGWCALLLMPVAAGVVALVTARVTVLSILGRMS